MSKIIIDMGSGETCKNDKKYVARMIDELAAVDTHKHLVFIKWQLFHAVPAGVPPLELDTYLFAVRYALAHDYLTSASVFDVPLLEYLLSYENLSLPFVKLACRPNLYHFIDRIPQTVPVYISVPHVSWGECLMQMFPRLSGAPIFLYCIPEYPAKSKDYEQEFGDHLGYGISDHSPNLGLFKKYQPLYYERHYKLSDSTGLDAGPHASTPEELKEIL
jgi:hypothetical protein